MKMGKNSIFRTFLNWNSSFLLIYMHSKSRGTVLDKQLLDNRILQILKSKMETKRPFT